MNGELDFAASLKERVSLLKGVPADVFEKLKSVITISPGARELCKALKALGYKLAVLSGGFQPLAEWLAGELGIDHAFANHVRISPTFALHLRLPLGFQNYDGTICTSLLTFSLVGGRRVVTNPDRQTCSGPSYH